MDEDNKTLEGQETNAGAEATEQGQDQQEQKFSLEGVDIDKLFEDETIQKKVQSISDKRVTEALKTAKDKWQQELEDMQDEAKKLQKMSKEEKERYQFEKDKAEFLKQKQAFEHNQLELQTAKQLLDNGLPDLSSFITGKDAETTAGNIKLLAETLGEWKQGILNESLKGGAPKDTTPAKSITRDQLKNMTPAEINEAFNNGLIDLTK